MKTCIIDKNAPFEAKNELKKYFSKIVETTKIDSIQGSTSTHPDMQLIKINDKTLICEPSVYLYYQEQFKNTDINIICGNKKITSPYPNDIAYNAVIFNDYIFHLNSYSIFDNDKIISAKQGYTKCSTCVINNAVITDDKGLYKIYKNHNINCLLINKSKITLKGNNYGFFGGCTGAYENILYVCGVLENHCDFNKINKFLTENNMNYKNIYNGELTDIGSIIFI